MVQHFHFIVAPYPTNALLDPIKDRLLSLEAVLTILKLSVSIYPPGSWQVYPSQMGDLNETWTLRSGISNWAWRTITELRDVKEECLLCSYSSSFLKR